MKRTAYLGCAFLLTAALAIPVFARPQAAPAQNDGAAYTTFYSETNPQKKAELGEKFVADFKSSQYAEPTFRAVVDIYVKAGNWPKVLELTGKADQLFPAMAAASKARMYANGMNAAQQSNNAAQTIAFGDKVLSIAPDDLNTLITLASTIPALSPNDQAALAKAEGYAGKALTAVAKFDPKANGISDADWAKQRPGIEGTLHSTLGSIAFNKGDYEKATTELTEATKVTPKDGNTWYLLGLTQYQQSQAATKVYLAALEESNTLIRSNGDKAMIEESKAKSDALAEEARAKRDAAIETFATAVACGGATQQPAMTQLQKLYTLKNNGSTDGLDALISTKKAWLQSLPS